MKIVLNKCDGMDDWYTIIKAEHDGRVWVEDISESSGIPRHQKLMLSERISDACVEGTAYEMLEIAKAIKEKADISFRRCAVSFEYDGVHFYSPRNSSIDGIVSIDEADELADQILEKLGA